MDKNLLQDINLKLKKKGVTESDVVYFESETISASSRLGKLEKTEKSEVQEIGIRAIINYRQSIISSTNLDKKNLDLLIDKVVDMAKFVPKDKYCGLAKEKQIFDKETDDLKKLDQFDSFTPSQDDLEDSVLLLENSALENKRISNSEGAEIACTKNNFLLMASNGLTQEFKKTHSDYIIAVLAENSKSMEREYDYKSKVFFKDLGNFKKIGQKVSKKALKKLNSKKVKTCKVNVIFDSRVSSSLLGNLFNACNSSTIIRGTSFLKDKIEKKLFDSQINIIDNPRLKGKLRSRISDCEGIESNEKHLIKDGKLKFFFNCLSTAKQLKDNFSGHASRGVSTIPSPSYTNLFMKNGTEKLENIIKSQKKGLLVTELMGSSINYSNGDYSRGASGFWIENGEIAFPVSEITIASNLKEMFKSLTPANDLEFNYGVNAPSLLIEDMMVGGI